MTDSISNSDINSIGPLYATLLTLSHTQLTLYITGHD